jgi:hypothetical protein
MENDDVLGVVALRLELGHGTGRAESDISGKFNVRKSVQGEGDNACVARN